MNWKTPSRTSPQGTQRACLCPNGTYSRKCCDGSLTAQGIGRTTGIDQTTPVFIPWYWGTSDTPLNATQIATIIENGGGNMIQQYANGDLPVAFMAVGKYLWVAHSESFVSKTRWYNTDLNQGAIGGDGLFADITIGWVTNPYWTTTFKFYISNYPTTTSGQIILKNS